MPAGNDSGKFRRWLEALGLDKYLKEFEADKLVHIGLFFILVALWCWAVAELKISYLSKFLSFIIVAQTWFFYGIAMEFVQEYLKNGRSFDVKDMIADGIGCGLALLASIPFIRRKQSADPL
ncbi:MAG: hypothetical protein EB047_00905 [Chitinophagaceae bacterium]|jgi:VanZ family protein|nr:hypothetical protein [Chitinophagaceae bacterium]